MNDLKVIRKEAWVNNSKECREELQQLKKKGVSGR